MNAIEELNRDGYWSAFECSGCCLFEVRWEAVIEHAGCPRCGKRLEYRAMWEATEGGYGCTGEKDLMIDKLASLFLRSGERWSYSGVLEVIRLLHDVADHMNEALSSGGEVGSPTAEASHG
jgi:hypothetical protein